MFSLMYRTRQSLGRAKSFTACTMENAFHRKMRPSATVNRAIQAMIAIQMLTNALFSRVKMEVHATMKSTTTHAIARLFLPVETAT
ncbi:hypothetical protein DPMN_087326 [Dreissena polymorpha]|uniref:Uncharacterized protein n=1 Tax=Dreissena polymorpha TaxID=45954 RepID=A0A9D4QW96_DREPO|nr:hypothetical protein DPMN_087326 [Dreissena polymorpha]